MPNFIFNLMEIHGVGFLIFMWTVDYMIERYVFGQPAQPQPQPRRVWAQGEILRFPIGSRRRG
ncbi:unnamed protein product [Orchesella dallaii]|uniref:Uncharacterized protein n=1 Tax=Orchesella dallaii TaxID=48710 RepID=A0ABP1RZD3_9HEXA